MSKKKIMIYDYEIIVDVDALSSELKNKIYELLICETNNVSEISVFSSSHEFRTDPHPHVLFTYADKSLKVFCLRLTVHEEKYIPPPLEKSVQGVNT